MSQGQNLPLSLGLNVCKQVKYILFCGQHVDRGGGPLDRCCGFREKNAETAVL